MADQVVRASRATSNPLRADTFLTLCMLPSSPSFVSFLRPLSFLALALPSSLLTPPLCAYHVGCSLHALPKTVAITFHFMSRRVISQGIPFTPRSTHNNSVSPHSYGTHTELIRDSYGTHGVCFVCKNTWFGEHSYGTHTGHIHTGLIRYFRGSRF